MMHWLLNRVPHCEQPHTAELRIVTFCHRVFRNSIIIEFSRSSAMQFPVLLPGALSDLFAQVSISGCITQADRYGLMAALLEEELGSEERSVIDRLLRAVRRGRLTIADEVSAIV